MNICVRIFAPLLLMSPVFGSAQSTPPPNSPAVSPQAVQLEDGTPVKIRIGRTVSSADAHVGDIVDFEVLEEVRVGSLLVIPKGGVAWGTVTDAQSKRRMARGGKLDMNIDSVRLTDGEKVALRAVKEVKGGGHTGAMTGAIVGTAIVFFPAAPLFLFMHGKDITIPKGTEVTAYVNGNFPVDSAKFQSNGSPIQVAATNNGAVGNATLEISSTPPNADIEVDGNFIGNTPSSLGLASGEHTIKITKSGYKPWQRKITTSTGVAKLSPELEIVSPGTTAPTIAEPATSETKRTSPALLKTTAPVEQMIPNSVTVSTHLASTTDVAHGAATATPLAGMGSISITSAPDGGEIFVDSIGRGKSPSIVKLSAGSHVIQIVMPGYKDWTSSVVVKSDAVVDVMANFEK
jgi:hypothetical protein